MIFELIVSAAFIVALFFFTTRKRREELFNFPPGPKPYPLIGNLPQLMGPLRHLAFDNLAKDYGKIYSLTLPGGQRCVIINTADLAREALLTRKDEFSGRPYTFVGDYLSRDTANIICADFTTTMVRLRRIAHSALKMYGSGLKRLEDKICIEVDELAQRFIAHDGNPVDPKDDIAVAVLNVICSLVYGHSYSVDDPEFQRIVEYNDIFIHIFGSYNILDMFPWLRYLPFKTARLVDRGKAIRDDIISRQYYDHKEKFQIENANNNFQINDLTDALLQAAEDEKSDPGYGKYEPLSEDNIMMTMQDVFNAGFETTTTAVRWLLAFMVRYPEVQAKIHREMDKVIGSGRLPDLRDRHNLPYFDSVVAEVLRLKTLVPLSLPHKATCDTNLAGYDIPKGTTVIPNLWSIHHNEDDWQNPEDFNPKRFLDAEGKFTAAGERAFLPFSAGRRSCLGQSLAKTELFLISARILHQFEFTRSPDHPLPTLKGIAGVVVHPEHYKLVIKERV